MFALNLFDWHRWSSAIVWRMYRYRSLESLVPSIKRNGLPPVRERLGYKHSVCVCVCVHCDALVVASAASLNAFSLRTHIKYPSWGSGVCAKRWDRQQRHAVLHTHTSTDQNTYTHTYNPKRRRATTANARSGSWYIKWSSRQIHFQM